MLRILEALAGILSTFPIIIVFGREKWEDRKFKVFFSYISSLEPAWVTQDPTSNSGGLYASETGLFVFTLKEERKMLALWFLLEEGEAQSYVLQQFKHQFTFITAVI